MRQHGFTLIEILIVMLIIGITMGIAVISMTQNPHHEARTASDRLIYQLQLAEEESLLRPATFALVLTPCGWKFEILAESPSHHGMTWQTVTDRALAATCLPKKLMMQLSIKRVIISPGGDLSPFVILIGKKNAPPDWKITGRADGDIQLRPAHAS